MRNKIKYFLSMHNHTLTDYANYMKMTPQSLNSKFTSNTLRLKDIQALAKLTNTRLAFVDDDGIAIMDITDDE